MDKASKSFFRWRGKLYGLPDRHGVGLFEQCAPIHCGRYGEFKGTQAAIVQPKNAAGFSSHMRLYHDGAKITEHVSDVGFIGRLCQGPADDGLDDTGVRVFLGKLHGHIVVVCAVGMGDGKAGTPSQLELVPFVLVVGTFL